ncbi:hypothetical protein DTO013E5_6325 [Penicillium roqueforti]|uniref:CRAL-TRIO domain n=1 Tax=Penicillium roqueforti (strain FM164) TaxID=1365484 RepID=W6QLW9_PENRF|nr:uncharacterized protein LCP9604111_5290 [Penicillium roqueforti]CDM37803.1 CRAL-TRIO domain [Penicillium roqueforti FM164]KAF9248540.1 hypothetical protein LCP9604111_5290 [Penicillium roqueforti]KAI1832168.1 hypothetical protein CBS147337_6848 [Penicillium roqueforti]KAI2674137.1 hypothetical protein CBS147355_7312 [Penicillium roqueforti]KAI2699232.1 hypothetical protein CBS147372_6479 [Penicillium roqueforti]
MRGTILRRLYPSAKFPVARYSFARPFSTHPEPRKASSFWTLTFTLAVVGGGAWLQDRYFNPKDTITPQPQLSQEPFLGVIDTLATMPAQLAPGTVGNLTPEQEVKLQEFWVLALKVFGLTFEELEAPVSAAPSEAPTPAPVQDKKKSKGRWGIWSRGDDDETKSAPSSGAGTSIASISLADGDDKYGQSKEFKQALEDMKPEEIRTAFWNMVKGDNPDSLLLRFLRARKWDIKKALVMLISTMRWRLLEMHVDDDIMFNGEALALKMSQGSDPIEKKKGEDFLTQIRLGKSFLHGVDRTGRPICVVRVRLHRAGDQENEGLERFTVYTIETARLLLAPPIETATIIFDMTDFGMANMDYAPVKFMIKCFEANYPESLGAVLIHKAPWIFSSIWGVIKGWLDPVVAAKIHFTKNRQDLEQYIHPSQILKELEGDEDWEYKYVEVPENENPKMADKETRDTLVAERQKLAKEIQDVTVEWISTSFKKKTDAASAAKEKRNSLIEQLRAQYWVLDPYVRARSLYDRLNIVQGGGKINFYPGLEKGAETSA